MFGEGFEGLFVFAYNVVGDRAPLESERMFEYRGALYGFVGIRLSDYAEHARPISPSWDTVAMPTAEFRRLARPVGEYLLPGPEEAGTTIPDDDSTIPGAGRHVE